MWVTHKITLHDKERRGCNAKKLYSLQRGEGFENLEMANSYERHFWNIL